MPDGRRHDFDVFQAHRNIPKITLKSPVSYDVGWHNALVIQTPMFILSQSILIPYTGRYRSLKKDISRKMCN